MNYYNIGNKKYYMLYTVGASAEIAEICPNGDLNKLADVLQSKNYAEVVNAINSIAIILNKYANIYITVFERTEEKNILEKDILSLIGIQDYNKLSTIVLQTIADGSKTTVEIEQKN